MQPLRTLGTAVVAVLLAACAAKPVHTEKPLVRKIAVIPATEPAAITLVNENRAVPILFPLASVAVYADSKEKSKAFDAAMKAKRRALATRLTTTVVESLRAAGYELVVLDDIVRPAEDPDDVDYEKLSTDAEMILQLKIDDVGVFSGTFTKDYLPRVNAQAKLYVRSRDDSIYDENIYWGADAKPGKPFMIVADPKYAYPTFESVLAETGAFADVFEIGIDAVGKMMSAQLLEALQTKARKAP